MEACAERCRTAPSSWDAIVLVLAGGPDIERLDASRRLCAIDRHPVWLRRPREPRTLHIFTWSAVAALDLAALLIGLITGVGQSAVGRSLSPRFAAALGGEVSKTGLVVGCLVGGASHALLDGIFHLDVRPWHEGDPFFGVVGTSNLQLLCVAAAAGRARPEFAISL